jgi:4-hydroxy-3-polyprenylbenzoate decarboxylase
MEDKYIGLATERIFLPLARLFVPEMIDYHLPAEGAFHNLALVRIKKRYPGHAFKVMHALWGLGQMMFTKCIVVFDEDVDVQNPAEAVWRAFANIDPERDITFVKGPIDVLDHASPLMAFGSKMGVDATRKWPDEGFAREWPDVLTMPADVKAKVDKMWKELGIER